MAWKTAFYGNESGAERFADSLRTAGLKTVRVDRRDRRSARPGAPLTTIWAVTYNKPKRWGKGNPRKIKGKSTTLRNMASVTIQKLPNGVVKITGRKIGSWRRKR